MKNKGTETGQNICKLTCKMHTVVESFLSNYNVNHDHWLENGGVALNTIQIEQMG